MPRATTQSGEDARLVGGWRGCWALHGRHPSLRVYDGGGRGEDKHLSFARSCPGTRGVSLYFRLIQLGQDQASSISMGVCLKVSLFPTLLSSPLLLHGTAHSVRFRFLQFTPLFCWLSTFSGFRASREEKGLLSAFPPHSGLRCWPDSSFVPGQGGK